MKQIQKWFELIAGIRPEELARAERAREIFAPPNWISGYCIPRLLAPTVPDNPYSGLNQSKTRAALAGLNPTKAAGAAFVHSLEVS